MQQANKKTRHVSTQARRHAGTQARSACAGTLSQATRVAIGHLHRLQLRLALQIERHAALYTAVQLVGGPDQRTHYMTDRCTHYTTDLCRMLSRTCQHPICRTPASTAQSTALACAIHVDSARHVAGCRQKSCAPADATITDYAGANAKPQLHPRGDSPGTREREHRPYADAMLCYTRHPAQQNTLAHFRWIAQHTTRLSGSPL